jgi:hypothetical protein
MFGYSEFAAIRKEAEVIKAAPVSFFVVCLVIGGLMWTGFHIVYKGELDGAHQQTEDWKGTASRWESETQFWKDLSSRPTIEVTPPAQAAPTPSGPKPSVPPRQGKDKPHAGVVVPVAPPEPSQPSQVVAENNGIAIRGDNNGIATVNNIGQVARSLSDSQASVLGGVLNLPDANFEGITAILGDPESLRFAEQIRGVFAAHGWPKSDGLNQAVYTGVMPGILIGISPDDVIVPPPVELALYNAFKLDGFVVHATVIKSMAKGHFSLIVGSDVQAA